MVERPIPKDETLSQITEFSLEEVSKEVGRVSGQRAPPRGRALST